MNKMAEKKNRFFVYLFLISFVVCEVVMVTDYIRKQQERGVEMSWLEETFGELEALMAQAKGKGLLELPEDLFLSTGGKPAYQNGSETVEEATGETIQEENNESEGGNHGSEQTENSLAKDSLIENDNPAMEEQQLRSFVTAGYDYFEDALFIGDSRTVGLMEYGNLENTVFFADSGMSVFSLQSKKVSVPELGKVTLAEILQEKQYGKIYLMLGINELGYQFEVVQKKYQETVEYIRSFQGNAVIFLCANLHVTEEQSEKDPIYNNTNVNRVNEMIAGLADNINYFYVDVNELFDDENGNLDEEYCSDSFHVYGKDYKSWIDWLCTKAVVD